MSWSKTKVFATVRGDQSVRRIHSIRFAEWCGAHVERARVSMDWSARMWSGGEEVGGLVRAVVVVGDLDSGSRGSGKAFVGYGEDVDYGVVGDVLLLADRRTFLKKEVDR